APGRVVVSRFTIAAAVHMSRNDVHFSGRRRPDLRSVNVFKRAAARHESMPFDIGVSEAAQLLIEPSYSVAITFGPLHAVAELRQSLDVGFVSVQIEAADGNTRGSRRRIWCLRGKRCGEDQRC